MSSGTYLHIYINPKTDVSNDKVETQINLAVDWFRYASDSYVVYTTSDIEKWMGRLKPLVEPGGRLLIFEIKVNRRNGWMTEDFWEWLKKPRT
jgi:hypothetical protein